MVCGISLTYHEKAEEFTCIYCGTVDQGHISCSKGHHICDVCHNRDSVANVEGLAFNSRSRNPFEIAETAMSLPTLPMLGCQHAYIAGGALMAAIKNQGLGRVTNQQIKEVFDRTRKQAHGGYCGLTGVCGIAPAIGACFAVITGSRCGKDTEQRITMEAVTRVSRAIAGLTGPSCCKAYVRTSLATAVAYLKESLAIELPLAETPLCDYGVKHPHGCREFRCPYFKGNGRLEESATASGKATGDLAGSRGYLEKQSRDEDFDYLLKKAVELGAEKAKTPVPFYER